MTSTVYSSGITDGVEIGGRRTSLADTGVEIGGRRTSLNDTGTCSDLAQGTVGDSTNVSWIGMEPESMEWFELTDPTTGNDFYANVITGECSWKKPTCGKIISDNLPEWWELWDADRKRIYYFNNITKATYWTLPPNLGVVPVPHSSSDDANIRKALVRGAFYETLSGSPPAIDGGEDHSGISSPITLGTPTTSVPVSSVFKSSSDSTTHVSVPTGACKPVSLSSLNNAQSVSAPTLKEKLGNNMTAISILSSSEDTTTSSSQSSFSVSPSSSSSSSKSTFQSLIPKRPNGLFKKKNSQKSNSVVIPNLSAIVGPGSSAASNRGTMPPLTTSEEPAKSNRQNPSRWTLSTPNKLLPLRLSRNTVRIEDGELGEMETSEFALTDRRSTALGRDRESEDKKLDNEILDRISKYREESDNPSVEHYQAMKKVSQEINEFSLESFLCKPKTVFKKKQPLSTLAQWQKTALTGSLLRSGPASKEAVGLFKKIQQFMGDLGRNPGDPLAAHFVLSVGVKRGGSRDEIYCQICKQLTNNPSKESQYKGWDLLSLCLQHFSPTRGLYDWLIKFITDCESTTDPKIERYSKFCQSKLKKIYEQGGIGVVPEVDQIVDMIGAPFQTPIFGGTLEEIMEYQKLKIDSELDVPKPLVFLCSCLLERPIQEDGINFFQTASSHSDLISLRLSIESGDYRNTSPNSPQVAASLLKQWLRELSSPVIPVEFFSRAIECTQTGNPNLCCDLITQHLPDLNRKTLSHVIKFLREIMKKNEKVQGWDSSSLAMIFAPNLMRYPGTDPEEITVMGKWLRQFLQILLNHLPID